MDAIDIDSSDRRTFGIFLRLFGLILSITLFDCSRYITAWCGDHGIFPLQQLLQKQREFYPSLLARMLYWPSSWLFYFSSNAGLRGLAIGGGLSALLYSLVGHPLLLIVPGLILIMLYEPCTLQWPWHYLTSELWWILVIASAGSNNTWLQPVTSFSLDAMESPSFPLLFALRFLLFRVIFGFGKLKFSGSTLKDRMYVRPFSSMLPILSIIGLAGFRRTPRALFIVAYAGFFFGEMVVPFAYFLPQPYRSWAGINTMLLMLGIQISGNFGTFNALTALLSSTLLVTGKGPQDIDFTIPGTLGLVLHALSGLCLIPFNSWVSASWFFWPTIRRALPNATRYFEFLGLWRICNSYGVFPPNIMSTLRQIPVYQISDDGKNWTSLRYRYQPTQPSDKAHFIPLLHPILDFVSFYYVGYGGFFKTLFDMRSPCPNLQCRPINAVARNLLQDGDAKLLFAKESTDLLWKKAPKYVRVYQQAMLPLEQHEWIQEGCVNEWKIVGGTLELPPVNAADLDGPWLPPPYVTSLDESDPCMTVWRRRSGPYQAALLHQRQQQPGSAIFQPQVKELLKKAEASGSLDLNAAADFHDELMVRHGSGAMGRLRCALQRAAYARLQVLEDVHFFGSTVASSTPPDPFDLYLVALSNAALAIADPSTEGRISTANTSCFVVSEKDLSLGMFVFTFLYSPILRVEASVYRRMIHGRCGVEKIDPEGDKIAPAGLRVVRQLSRVLRFPQVDETLHQFAFNHTSLEYEFVGAVKDSEHSWPWTPPKAFS